ncbi:hypothetical protein [Kingella potus]|uniref:hypothetical protein n=1 Tax=Kingella potus TaxID=265175 RepID=UPI001FD0E351|nr:hypothetical protein [Kingella potus]UOP01975.1 hypothetical protein LVJ84_06095 [Kingella potus]
MEGNVTLPLVRDKLTWSTNFTYMSRNKDKRRDNPVSIVPKYTINSTLNWQIIPRWDFNATYTYYGTASRPAATPPALWMSSTPPARASSANTGWAATASSASTSATIGKTVSMSGQA